MAPTTRAAFRDLARLRRSDGIPAADEEAGQAFTRARLDIADRRFYGRSAPASVHPCPQGVTFQTMLHAEGDAFGQAIAARVAADVAVLYVDRTKLPLRVRLDPMMDRPTGSRGNSDDHHRGDHAPGDPPGDHL